MSLDLASVLIGIEVGIITYVTYFYFKYFTRPNPIPGPIPLPIVGNLHQYPGDISALSRKYQKEYGDIWEFYFGHPSNKTRGVIIGRPDLLKKIYTTNSRTSNYTLRTTSNDGLDELGTSYRGIIFNRDYQTWQYYRKFYRVLLTPRFVKQAAIWIQEIFEEMEGCWEKLGVETEIESDLSKWMIRFTTEVTFRITTSKKVYALANYFNKISPKEKMKIGFTMLKESEEFIHRIDDFFVSMCYFFLTPKWKRYFPMGGFKENTLYLLDRRDKTMQDLLNIVHQRRKEIDNTPLDIPIQPDMLNMFLTINTPRDITEKIADETNHEPMTDEAIVGNFMDIMAGGIDAIAVTFCYIVYALDHHPKVKERFLQEIDSNFSRDQKISYEDLNRLPYCEALIKEVSRMYSTFDVNYRMSNNDDILDGYTIPAETQIFIHQHGINNHKDHWTNPEEFNPDRFFTNQDNNITHTFGGGMKMCPGRNLAMMELKGLMVMLYRKYDVKLVDKNVSLKTHYTIVRHCDELKVWIKPRKF